MPLEEREKGLSSVLPIAECVDMGMSIVSGGPEFATTITLGTHPTPAGTTLVLHKNQFAQLIWNGILLDFFDRPGSYPFSPESTPLAAAAGAWSETFLGQVIVVRTDTSPTFSVFTPQPITVPGRPDQNVQFHAYFKVSIHHIPQFITRINPPEAPLTEDQVVRQIRSLIQSCAYQILKGDGNDSSSFSDQLVTAVAKELKEFGMVLRMLWVENFKVAGPVAQREHPPATMCPRCEDPWNPPFCHSCGYESEAA